MNTTNIDAMQATLNQAAGRITLRFLGTPIGKMPAVANEEFTKNRVPGSEYALRERLTQLVIDELKSNLPGCRPELTVSTKTDADTIIVRATVQLTHI